MRREAGRYGGESDINKWTKGKVGRGKRSVDGRGPRIPLPACLQTLDYRAGVVDNGSGPISLVGEEDRDGRMKGTCPYQVTTKGYLFFLLST